ncbi:phage head closure protein [Sphingomonas longa]|uniref:phage head closure protein n=1 Tax=Sphingomonas longa TaxID=2778730 RepID=UPI0023B835D3|nr:MULTISPECIES: phage head closure protein [Alphaproteobacteria]
MIPAGSLNRRIRIFAPEAVSSATGMETVEWVLLASAFAAQKGLTYKDATRMAGLDVTAEAKFVIRYRQGIDATMQVECEGKRYSIISVEEQGNREGLELLVRAV